MKFSGRFIILGIMILIAACETTGTSVPHGTRVAPPTVTPILWRGGGEPIVAANANRLVRVGSLAAHTATVNHITFAHNGGSMLSQDGTGQVIVWNLNSGTKRFTLAGGGAILSAFYNTDDSLIITAGVDNRVRVWKANDGTLINTAQGEASGVTAVASTADGGTLALGNNDGFIAIWRPSDGRTPTFSVQGEKGRLIRALAFATDGKTFVSIASDNVVRIWDASDGTPKRQLTGFTQPTQVAFSGDGLLMAVADGTTIHLYDTTDFKEHPALTQSDLAAALGMAFSPDGKFIAAGGIGAFVYVWTTADGKLAAHLPGHDKQFTSLAWSPNGQLLLTTSPAANGGAFVWNTSSFEPKNESYQRGPVSSPGEAIYLVAWSPDGKLLITADARGNMTAWGIPAAR